MTSLKKATKEPESAFKPAKDYAILFDMDGVLVDVTGSYRRAIQETVRFFTGKKAQPEEIQGLKEQGGYNNDWDLTEAILISRGKAVPKVDIVKKFQEFYLGVEGRKGFIENEKWQLNKELLEQLHKEHLLGIVTGRPKEEALFVLRKFGLEKMFDAIVALEDYPSEKSKPDPYPINLALEKINRKKAVYVGDSVDDITAAKRAGVRAIGCIPSGVSANRLKEKLLKNGAEKVVNNINEIAKILL